MVKALRRAKQDPAAGADALMAFARYAVTGERTPEAEVGALLVDDYLRSRRLG